MSDQPGVTANFSMDCPTCGPGTIQFLDGEMVPHGCGYQPPGVLLDMSEEDDIEDRAPSVRSSPMPETTEPLTRIRETTQRFAAAGLVVEHFAMNPNGITVVGKLPGRLPNFEVFVDDTHLVGVRFVTFGPGVRGHIELRIPTGAPENWRPPLGGHRLRFVYEHPVDGTRTTLWEGDATLAVNERRSHEHARILVVDIHPAHWEADADG